MGGGHIARPHCLPSVSNPGLWDLSILGVNNFGEAVGRGATSTSSALERASQRGFGYDNAVFG